MNDYLDDVIDAVSTGRDVVVCAGLLVVLSPVFSVHLLGMAVSGFMAWKHRTLNTESNSSGNSNSSNRPGSMDSWRQR